MKNLFLFLILISGTAFAQTHEPIYKDTVFYGKHKYKDPEFYTEKIGDLTMKKYIITGSTVALGTLIYFQDKTNHKAINLVLGAGALSLTALFITMDVYTYRLGQAVKERTHFSIKANPTTIGLSYNF